MDKTLIEFRYMPAALSALESFPIDVERAEFIAHSENVTFRILVRDCNTDYVLRLHRPGYNTIEELESERTWTRELSESGISVPDSLVTRSGKNFVLTEIPSTNEQCYAGMTTWFEGVPVSEYLKKSYGEDRRKCIFHRIGVIAAAVHNQSANWNVPPGFTRRRLDLDGLLGETPHWGRFWDHTNLSDTERNLLLGARQRACDTLVNYGKTLANFSLIHADLHPDNFIHDGNDLMLIDFDDSAYGWHMYDIASALIDDWWTEDFETVCVALLDGYREHRPLSKRDVEILQVFLLIRGMVTIGWFHQRPEHKGSEYFEKVKHWVLEKCRSPVPR